MSDPIAKSQRSEAKDLRQQPAPDRPSNGKRKKERYKPFVVVQDLPIRSYPCVIETGFETLEQAEKYVEKNCRNLPLDHKRRSMYKIEDRRK